MSTLWLGFLTETLLSFQMLSVLKGISYRKLPRITSFHRSLSVPWRTFHAPSRVTEGVHDLSPVLRRSSGEVGSKVSSNYLLRVDHIFFLLLCLDRCKNPHTTPEGGSGCKGCCSRLL